MSDNKLIYIFGSGRSGSTLITSLLNLQHGFMGAGELNRGFVNINNSCSCGQKIIECPYWQPIIDFVNQETAINPQDFYSTNAKLEKKKSFTQWLLGLKKNDFKRYQAFNSSLITGASQVTNGNIIIDSSKNIMRYFLLSQFVENIALIHSVRNPRAVLYSNEKKYYRKNLKNLKNLLRFKSIYLSYILLSWNITNFYGSILGLFNKQKYILVKYEDIAVNPFSVSDHITLKILNSKFKPTKMDHHNLYGNRMIQSFSLDGINLDEEWKENISWYQNLAVHILTFPTIWIYGYGYSK